MARILRITRKLIGVALLVVNMIISFTSFMAAYSAVYTVQNSINENMIDVNLSNHLSDATPYLYIGQINFSNSGIFGFDDFTADMHLFDETNETIMLYANTYGEINPGELLDKHINMTFGNESNSISYLNPSIDLLAVNWSAVHGFIILTGSYAFSLFEFSLNITNLQGIGWSWV
ncbi:MAG: hypothetical protein ACTSUE_21800 [Promethearchaeota archaeon]